MASSRRRMVSLAGATMAVLLALAVGFGAGYVTRDQTVTTTTAPPVTTTTGSSSTSTSSPPTSTVVPLARCAGGSLRGTETGSTGAAGTITVVFQLTNPGPAGCLLTGYPLIQLLSSTGAAITTSTVDDDASFSAAAANARPAGQRLAAGTSASVQLQYSDVPVGTEQVCPASATVDVYPPGSRTAVAVTSQLAPCDQGTVHVSPFYGAT